MNYQHIINQCDDNGVEDSLWDYLPVEPVVKVEALDDDDDTSDDEIVPSAIVEPILLKPDSAEDEEIVLDLKPEPYLDNHTGRMHMEPYSSHDQSWSSDMARRTIQELNLRAADSKLAAVQARRRAQRLLGPAGIHKIRSYMVAFQHQRYTAKYGFYSAKYGLRQM
ncbi:uncharacterized protein LOC124802403 isoform X1 [Schistocerca piceifrons]|uniref:uncharacterized protein LOC124802403 isoform X1 n=1 Tax=Schistocerca piceifrons TaxID=274613 RepID=UPI001F5F6975|nr:uncharacterized protein LOC124802403 isoform X1 [Schistocerca piceifrons]